MKPIDLREAGLDVIFETLYLKCPRYSKKFLDSDLYLICTGGYKYGCLSSLTDTLTRKDNWS